MDFGGCTAIINSPGKVDEHFLTASYDWTQNIDKTQLHQEKLFEKDVNECLYDVSCKNCIMRMKKTSYFAYLWVGMMNDILIYQSPLIIVSSSHSITAKL